MRAERALPLISAVASLLAWQAVVSGFAIPPYILPGPVAVAQAFAAAPLVLLRSLMSTLAVTAAALAGSLVIGVGLAAATALSRWARAAVMPWAVVLQVTPVVAIAPLIIIWVGEPFAALVVCATVVAFFPLFSNTMAGLSAAPPELVDLFRLHRAGRVRTLLLLRLPVALPFVLAGLRVSSGLALVGAVVAEFVAGSGGVASGLAFRILEAGYRLQIPRMFAALALLAAAGLAINLAASALERWALRRYGTA